MRTFRVWLVAAAVVAAFAIPLPTVAQQKSDTAPPPPKLEKLEEGEPPAVTIRPRDKRAKITQKRAPGGKVTEVKVTTGGSTYVVKSNDQAGSALPGDAQSSTMRPAQWEVLEFDLGKSREAKEAEEAQAGTLPAPPQAPATAAPKK
ncbi:MAG TPA: DUF2782 domain-containing protein [Noviherbaspirillum sp.]|uniref:DUF2782 domain-containing protein n=1 Tax=Noviherbaspirillum sp. TaxID=1926288 RepID=UPI002B48CD70|nr:DUF2782 domain-containing protein [Noviherbaspirillum sp.]HJV84801.1 DUF2782 domain-containing protein [Noviherbaspirillum sp.]